MRYLLDLLAITLMGDAMAKIFSGKYHNRFYQFRDAPKGYNQALETLAQRPVLNLGVAIGMLFLGGMLSRRMERQAV